MMNGIELKISNNKHFKEAPKIGKKFSAEEKQKLAKSSRDFESLLTSMMIKSMTKSTGGLLGKDNYGGDIFDTVFEQKISEYISQSKSLGVADVLYKKLTGEDLPEAIKIKKEIKPESSNLIKQKTKIKDIPKAKDVTAIKPSNSSLNRLKNFEHIINKAAEEFGVKDTLIKSIILTESAAKHDAVSSAKAKGLMQLMDTTAKELGVKNSFDPEENIFGGTKYISRLLKKYQDPKLALAAYNAGPENVDKYNGIPPFKETQNYVVRVLGYYNYLEE